LKHLKELLNIIKWAIENIREILNIPSLFVPDGYREKFALPE